MFTLLFSYLCECGRCHPAEHIPYSDELHQDFSEYYDQRDSYCLISIPCFRKQQISENRVAIKGKNYFIIEEGEHG